MASASIGDPQSLNLFAYVTNNPVDLVAPRGGGVAVEYNGARRFAIDYHSFKTKGQMVKKIHRHSVDTKTQMKKHRKVFSGKPYPK